MSVEIEEKRKLFVNIMQEESLARSFDLEFQITVV